MPRYCSTMVPSATRSEPSSRPTSSVSNSRRGRRPSSARHGRSWLAACRIHSASASAAFDRAAGRAARSGRSGRCRRRPGAAAPGRPAGCSGSPRPARRRPRPGRCRGQRRPRRRPARPAVVDGFGVPSRRLAQQTARAARPSGCVSGRRAGRLGRRRRSRHVSAPSTATPSGGSPAAVQSRSTKASRWADRSVSVAVQEPRSSSWVVLAGRARRRTGSRWSG